jgi:hypothetical protein
MLIVENDAIRAPPFIGAGTLLFMEGIKSAIEIVHDLCLWISIW